MAKYDDGSSRERNRPSEGFASKWRKENSRAEEEVTDWVNSTDGQIVLGLIGIIFLIGLGWNVVIEPLWRAVFG